MKYTRKSKKKIKVGNKNRNYKFGIEKNCVIIARTGKSVVKGRGKIRKAKASRLVFKRKIQKKVIVNPNPGGGTIPQDEK